MKPEPPLPDHPSSPRPAQAASRTRPTTAATLALALTVAVAALALPIPPAVAAPTPDPDAPFFQPGRLRALILSGRNNHDWRTTTPLLRQLLTDSGRFDVRVNESTDGLTPATLAPFDVLVMDYGGPRWNPTTEQAIEDFVRSGRGFVTVHGASYHFSGLEVLTDGHRGVGRKEPAWPAFRALVGCGWDAPPPQGYHGPRHTFQVQTTAPNHPILAGLGPQFPATDELYHGMTVAPGAEVIATAFSATKRGGTGRDEPMLVVTRFGQGRGFYTALGHELAAMAEPGFRSTFLRGTEWAASGQVTLPPNAGAVPAPTSTAPDTRVLVVTGGHDYDPAFYTLFQDRPGLRWRHAVSQREAFRADLRPSTDVVILYDMASDLDTQGRAHLRAYLESGGGLVVLHHALADLQDWEWWWKDVVGGRYVLKAEPDHPASDFLHDQWMEITPAGSHPVTDGIGALRLFDETYKRVWQSPAIRPLLTTANPTSDPVVGWIGPWPHSRVVCLQPGHGPETHLHPAYRALIGQAIRWTAAGKTRPTAR